MSGPRRAWILALVVCCVAPLRAQESERPPASGADATLWYRAPSFLPVRVELPDGWDPDRPASAVVALHGFGGSYARFHRVAAALNEAGFVVIFPQAPYRVSAADPDAGYSWGLNLWTPRPLTDDPDIDLRSTGLTVEELVPAAVERVDEVYPLDAVYVLGFSQGAIYAFLTGFYNSDRFEGIVAFGLAGFSRDWATVRGGELEDGNHLSVYLGLGRSDPMVPFADAESARDILLEAGYSVTLRGFEGGHVLPDAELRRAVDWLVEVDRNR